MSNPEFDLLLVGGRIANADGTFPGTVAVHEGKVAGVWHTAAVPAGPRAREVVDCSGQWLLPGGVDPHVHVGISFGSVQTPEDHYQCTRAALLGGTTTVVDFAIGRPGQSPLEAVEERLAGAREGALTDYALHGCFTDSDEPYLDQIPAMVERGVRTIKVYTTYRDELMASDELIASVMGSLLPYDGLTYVHAEDNSTIETLMEELGRDGAISFEMIREARPESAEVKAVVRVLEIADEAGAPVYFVHQSTPVATELTRRARLLGVPAYAEVCPHYITLDDHSYDHHRGECFTCCPPLRPRETVDALMDAVLQGHVDTLASDHCAFVTEMKVSNRSDLTAMPFGMPGVQTRLPVLLSELVVKRDMPISSLVELVSANPARLSGIYPRKGVIALGSDADIVVWSPDGSSTVTAGALAQASDYTPYEGWQVDGRIALVVRGGRVMVRDGRLLDETRGQLVASGPIDHTVLANLARKEIPA